jgi:hypothetical protein
MFLKYHSINKNKYIAFDPNLVQAVKNDVYKCTIDVILIDYTIELSTNEFTYDQVVEDIQRAKYNNAFTQDLEKELNDG